MEKASFDGGGIRQTTSSGAAHSATAAQSAALSANLGAAKSGEIDKRGGAALSVIPVLLTKEQAAACFGISERLFETLRTEPWMPRPVVLGQRVLRWKRAELEDAIAVLPRQPAPEAQPAQLRRAKIDRMKARGVAA